MADTASVTRTNKILIGTVAALSASVIAVSPAAQTSASMVVHEAQVAQQRAVALVAEVTDSPLTVYGDLINNTVYNVGTLLKQYAASPFPILGAIVENQVSYLKRIFDFSTAGAAFQTWWNTGTRESPAGKSLLASVQTALSKGDLGTAYDNFNKLTLFGIQNTVLPWLNGWLFSSTTTMGIPQQIFQNVSNALGSFFTTGTLVFGAFQSLYAPVSGAAFELSRALGSVVSTLAKGNVVGALTAAVNTPGAVLNALLNGFNYTDATNPWAGLLSPKDPACTGRCAGGGPISQFFITIAQKIAAALKVKTTTTTAAATTAAVAAASTDPTSSVVGETLGANVTSYTLSLDSATTSTDTADAKATTAAKAATDTKAAADTKAADAKAADATAVKTAADTTSEATSAADDTKAATVGGSTADTTSASADAKTDAGSSTKSSSSDSSSTGNSTKRAGKHDSAKSDSGSSASSSAGSSDSAGSSTSSTKQSAKHDSAKSGSAKSDSSKSSSSKHKSGKHKSGSSS